MKERSTLLIGNIFEEEKDKINIQEGEKVAKRINATHKLVNILEST